MTSRLDDVRNRAALSEIAWLAPSMTLLFVMFATYDVASHPPAERGWRLATSLIPIGVLGATAVLRRQRRIPPDRAGWVVAAGSLAVSVSLVITVHLSGLPSDVAYLLMMVVLNGAAALTGAQFLAAQSVPVIGATALLTAQSGIVAEVNVVDWLVVLLVALVSSIALHVARARGFEELAQMQDLVEQRAATDPLTGLGTRRAFDRAFDDVRARATAAERDVLLVFVDVDGLKQVNDGLGHDAGDLVLLAVTRAMRKAARPDDVLIRWGGDEFAVLGIGGPDDAKALEEALVQRIEAFNPLHGEWPGLVSTGAATVCPAEADREELVSAADADMYARRRRRRGLPEQRSGVDRRRIEAHEDV